MPASLLAANTRTKESNAPSEVPKASIDEAKNTPKMMKICGFDISEGSGAMMLWYRDETKSRNPHSSKSMFVAAANIASSREKGKVKDFVVFVPVQIVF